MKFKTTKILLTTILMITSLFFVSCGDDDSVNCGKIYEEISDSFDAYDEAYDNGD